MVVEDDSRALLSAAKERRDIVERYDRGRENVVFDEWEDPGFEVYHTTDRYGFIHDSRLPEKVDDTEREAINKEMERIEKWRRKIEKCQKSPKHWIEYARTPKFRERVHKGIPDRFRSLIWKKLLDVDKAMLDDKGKYEKLKQIARDTSPDIRQIDLDVNRTYRNHRMFRERFGIKQIHLFHVLAAYSMYNTEVGYCQGMSQIAALLLMYMDEEEAFYALDKLLTDDRHSMHGLFKPGFPKLLRYQDHLEKVLKKFQSKIYKYMNSNMIPPSLYAIKWFMQCYLDRTPFPLTLRLWDIYLLEGDRMLIPFAYTIFNVHKRKLLAMTMERFVHFLQQDLEADFGMSDDAAVKELEASSSFLRDWGQPPKSRDDSEKPPKKGDIESIPKYPTLAELEARHSAQIKLNDQPDVTNGSVRHKSRLTTQNSVRSIYDNHSPQLQHEADIHDHPSSYTSNNHPEKTQGKQASASEVPKTVAFQDGSPEVMVTTDDSEQNEMTLHFTEEQPCNEPAKLSADLNSTSLTDSYFEHQLERNLSDTDASSRRSRSLTPEFLSEVPQSSSHMFNRSDGFRVKSPTATLSTGTSMSSPGSEDRSPRAKNPPTPFPRTSSLHYQEKHPRFFMNHSLDEPNSPQNPPMLPPVNDVDTSHNHNDLPPRNAVNSPYMERGIEIPVYHDMNRPTTLPNKPRTVYTGSRPFPVPRRTSQNESVTVYPLHTALQNRSPMQSNSLRLMSPPAYNNAVTTQPFMYSPSQLNTFGNPRVPTPMMQMRMDGPRSPTSPPFNTSTLPSRFVVESRGNHPNNTTGRGGKKYYQVITDVSQRRAPRPLDRYDYDEQNEDGPRKPVFL